MLLLRALRWPYRFVLAAGKGLAQEVREARAAQVQTARPLVF